MTTPFHFFHAKVSVDDSGKPITTLTNRRVSLYNLDIQVQDNPVDFGDGNDQNLELSVGDIYSNPFPHRAIDLSDIWVKNHTSGSTANIVITGMIAE